MTDYEINDIRFRYLMESPHIVRDWWEMVLNGPKGAQRRWEWLDKLREYEGPAPLTNAVKGLDRACTGLQWTLQAIGGKRGLAYVYLDTSAPGWEVGGVDVLAWKLNDWRLDKAGTPWREVLEGWIERAQYFCALARSLANPIAPDLRVLVEPHNIHGPKRHTQFEGKCREFDDHAQRLWDDRMRCVGVRWAWGLTETSLANPDRPNAWWGRPFNHPPGSEIYTYYPKTPLLQEGTSALAGAFAEVGYDYLTLVTCADGRATRRALERLERWWRPYENVQRLRYQAKQAGVLARLDEEAHIREIAAKLPAFMESVQ